MVPSPEMSGNDFGEFLLGFRSLLYSGAVGMLVAFCIVLICIKEKPKTPPSRAQSKRAPQFEMVISCDAKVRSSSTSSFNNSDAITAVVAMKRSFFHQVICCFKNRSFVLLMICYG
nr:feline leukemia virus subgroup C [Hymenolepis microstoma]